MEMAPAIGPLELVPTRRWLPNCARLGGRMSPPLRSDRPILCRDARRTRLPVQLNFPSGLPGAKPDMPETGHASLFASGNSNADCALISLMNSLVGDAWLTKPGEVTACFHPLRRDGFPFGGERRGNGK
jgi:hypothetical protein